MVDRFLRDIQDAFLGNNEEESARDREGDRRVRPASEDPYGDPADEDQYGYISPASEDPYGDPADEEQYYRY